MENLKLLWKISQNVWKMKHKGVLQTKWNKNAYLGNGIKTLQSLKHHKTLLRAPANFQALQRYFSDDPKENKLKLTDAYSYLVWPSIVKTIKNWFYIYFIVKPYLDPDFTLEKFIEGSRLATEIVSHKLAEGKLAELEGLVTKDCLEDVKKNLSVLSAKQRHEIAIKKEDIYFSFPYELGILFDESKIMREEHPQERYLEITVVHHVLRGHKEMIDRGEPVQLSIGVQPEFRDKIFILNYRFIRNYTKGVSDQWTLNVINHFKPTEIV